jgi:hypothetical protein
MNPILPHPRQFGCALMGGSGSTGSSLLRTLFNRHSNVFSGEELNFFNKEQYFREWSKSSKNIFRRRFWTIPKTYGWFEYSGTGLLHPDYMWKIDELREVVRDSTSVFDFAHRFFERPLDEHGKNFWIEKTPSNCYCFNAFLERFENGKVIHTARDPHESICSLVRRGMTPYFATALWIYNTCAALAAAESPRYMLLRYEDLVSSPRLQIEKACAFLDLEYQEDMFNESRFDSADHTMNAGWRFSRDAEISRPNLQFDKMEEAVKQQVLAGLSILSVSERHAERLGAKWRTGQEACTQLGYEYRGTPATRRIGRSLRWSQLRERAWRTVRFSPTGNWNFPTSIQSD